jgi:hypothetical protein
MNLFPSLPIFLLLALFLPPSDNLLEFFPIFTLNVSPVNYDPDRPALTFIIATCNFWVVWGRHGYIMILLMKFKSYVSRPHLTFLNRRQACFLKNPVKLVILKFDCIG